MLAERVKEWNQQSLEKGIQKGMQKGAVQLLLRLLEKKFGKIPTKFAQQIHQADEEQILQWSESILTAKTFGDIFGH